MNTESMPAWEALLNFVNAISGPNWFYTGIGCDEEDAFAQLLACAHAPTPVARTTSGVIVLVTSPGTATPGEGFSAAGILMLEAGRRGLSAAVLPSLNADRARNALRLPPGHRPLAMFAIGTGATTRSTPSPELARTGMPGYKVRRVLAFMEDRLAEKVSLEELSSQVEMSRFHFCRMFRKSTGLTPHRWILQRRIESAKELMWKEGATLTDIAYQLGFSSQAHFTTAFRKLTGHSPKRWRDMQNGITGPHAERYAA